LELPIRENILDTRFEGKSIKVYIQGAREPLEGVVDEVAKYEVGLRVEGKAVILFRHAILYIVTEPMEFHGYSIEELGETILTADFIGSELEVHLVNGDVVKGKLTKLSRYEVGIVSNEGGLVIPKVSISYVVVS